MSGNNRGLVDSLTERISNWFDRLRDLSASSANSIKKLNKSSVDDEEDDTNSRRILVTANGHNNYSSNSRVDGSSSPSSSLHNRSSFQHLSAGNGGFGGSGYTELNGGSVPCPSCKGSGLIPRELESTLVALIPLNDDRLKPRKTWLLVLILVAISLVVGIALIYLLMPRTITLNSDELPVEMVTVFDRNMAPSMPIHIDFFFQNRINVTSANYMPVEVVNVTATIISKFQPWRSSDIVGQGSNRTLYDPSPLYLTRNTRELVFNNTVHLKDVAAEYCQTSFSHLIPLYVPFQFDISVTFRYYYGHQEQVMLSTQQQVCCVPNGNCTIW